LRVLSSFGANARKLEAIEAGGVGYIFKDAVRGWDHIWPAPSSRCRDYESPPDHVWRRWTRSRPD